MASIEKSAAAASGSRSRQAAPSWSSHFRAKTTSMSRTLDTGDSNNKNLLFILFKPFWTVIL